MTHIIALVVQVCICFVMYKMFKSDNNTLFNVILSDDEYMKKQCKHEDQLDVVKLMVIKSYLIEFAGLSIVTFIISHIFIAFDRPIYGLVIWTVAMVAIVIYHHISISGMNNDYINYKGEQSC